MADNCTSPPAEAATDAGVAGMGVSQIYDFFIFVFWCAAAGFDDASHKVIQSCLSSIQRRLATVDLRVCPV